VEESIRVRTVYRADLKTLPEAVIWTVAPAQELKVDKPPARPTTVIPAQVSLLVKWITAQPANREAATFASRMPQGR
jgi:hypothetical protein